MRGPASEGDHIPRFGAKKRCKFHLEEEAKEYSYTEGYESVLRRTDVPWRKSRNRNADIRRPKKSCLRDWEHGKRSSYVSGKSEKKALASEILLSESNKFD